MGTIFKIESNLAGFLGSESLVASSILTPSNVPPKSSQKPSIPSILRASAANSDKQQHAISSGNFPRNIPVIQSLTRQNLEAGRLEIIESKCLANYCSAAEGTLEMKQSPEFKLFSMKTLTRSDEPSNISVDLVPRPLALDSKAPREDTRVDFVMDALQIGKGVRRSSSGSLSGKRNLSSSSKELLSKTWSSWYGESVIVRKQKLRVSSLTHRCDLSLRTTLLHLLLRFSSWSNRMTSIIAKVERWTRTWRKQNVLVQCRHFLQRARHLRWLSNIRAYCVGKNCRAQFLRCLVAWHSIASQNGCERERDEFTMLMDTRESRVY